LFIIVLGRWICDWCCWRCRS